MYPRAFSARRATTTRASRYASTTRARRTSYLAARRRMGTPDAIPVTTTQIIRPPRGVYAGTHNFCRWITDRTVTLSASSAATGSSFPLAFTDVQGSAELTALYDQYRINFVEIFLTWSDYTAAVTGGGDPVATRQAGGPVLLAKRDYDDTTAPTAAQMRESAQTTMYRFDNQGSIIKLSYKPAIRNAVQAVGAAIAGSVRFNTRLDMTNNDVPHFGYKFLFEHPNLGGAGSPGQIVIRARVYFTCFNTR